MTITTFTHRVTTFFVLTALSLFTTNAICETVSAQEKPVVEQLVDTLTKLAHGPYKGFRSNHAKGIMATGTFTPTAEAASLSKAPHLQKESTPVTVRFSNATGVPVMPDADNNASPHGIAIRFSLPDGGLTDIVSISYNGFPVSNPEDFLGLLNAVAASGADAPKPSPIEQFLGTHPAALKFVTTPKPAPVSFTTLAFYGVNAFNFTNAKGESHYGRYRILPVAGEQSLPAEQLAIADPNYLMKELPERLKSGEAKFKIYVQLAEKDDPINDPTAVWPNDRKLVELGTLALKAVVADSQQAEKSIMFNPLLLPDGISPSSDPILLARPAAYAISFSRRIGQ
ncbi:MAG: catalase family peroxidase [Methylophilaceae bacterium]